MQLCAHPATSNLLAFLTGTFDKTHVLDSRQTSMENLGTLLQEMEVL